MKNSKKKLDLFNKRTKGAVEPDNNKLNCGKDKQKLWLWKTERQKPDLTKPEELETLSMK